MQAHSETILIEESPQDRLERIGFWLSVACAIHCLAMPVILTLLPFLGGTLLADHETEHWFLGISWLLAGFLLWQDYRKHKVSIPLFLLGFSVATKFIQELILGENFETIIAPIGGILIAVAYYLNWKYKAQCTCNQTH
jgi:MerC mercury resistance protein